MFYDIILQERVLLPLTNVLDECRTVVIVKGSIEKKNISLLYASLTTFLMKQTVQKYIPEALRGQSHISVHQQYSAEINTLIVTESFVALVVDFNSRNSNLTDGL